MYYNFVIMSDQAIKIQDLPLSGRLRLWRTTADNYTGAKMTLEEASARLEISIGHLSEMERGIWPVTPEVFRKYNKLDPERFPNKDFQLLL